MPDPNLKIRIETQADTSGVKATEEAIRDVGQEATTMASRVDAAFSRLDKQFDEAERNLSAFERKAGVAQPPPLPGAVPSAGAASGAASVAAGTFTGNLALDSFREVGQVALEFIQRLSEGATAAADMAVKLDTMDAAARKAYIDGLGPLGQTILDNRAALVQFAQDTDALKGRFNDLWTAAGAQLVPALNDVREELLAVDSTRFGAELGNTAAGAVVVFNELTNAVGELAASEMGSAVLEGVGKAATSATPGVIALADAINFLNKLGRERADAAASEQQTAEQAAQAERTRAQVTATMLQEIGKIRAEAALAALEPEERLAAIKEKQIEAQARLNQAMTVPAQEAAASEVVKLEAQIAATEKLIEQRKVAQDAIRQEAILTRELREATLAGDQEKITALESEIGYFQTLRKVKDENLARELQARDLAIDNEEKKRKELEASKKLEQQAAKELAAEAEKTSSSNKAAYLKQLQLDLQIALNEAIAAGNKDEEARVRWMQEYTRLMQQGFSEEDARRAANASSAARGATAAARGDAGAPVASASGPVQIGPQGRTSAPLQQSPFGPSSLNAPINITRATQPRDLSQELQAQGSQGYGTGPGAGTQPAGQGGQSGGIEKSAADLAKYIDLIQKTFEAVAKAAQEAQKKVEAQKAAEKIGGLGDAIKSADENLQRQIDDIRSQIV